MSRTRFDTTELTRVRRSPTRASYQRDLAYSILDQALIATVAFVQEGQPFAIPMALGRWRDCLVLHAARASRFARVLASGAELSISVTLVDGLVLARSAMHHSLNYRSVVIFGSAIEVKERAQKLEVLASIVEQVACGRSTECRPPNEQELKATAAFIVPLERVSIKSRSGGPIDDEADLGLPYWAGEIPLRQQPLPPRADPRSPPVNPEPPHYAPQGPASTSS